MTDIISSPEDEARIKRFEQRIFIGLIIIFFVIVISFFLLVTVKGWNIAGWLL